MPSGLLPAMELDGQLVIESAEIMRILEEAFPDNSPLLPPKGSPDRRRADGLMRLERRLFSDWLSWLTSPWCAFHPLLPEGALLVRCSVDRFTCSCIGQFMKLYDCGGCGISSAVLKQRPYSL